ncbi:MAG TPA: hypothetical protein VNN80_20850, partial [Polyangiaceae bacterium]|nr:hypothetical protein [Polyangiaceae bacterium]
MSGPRLIEPPLTEPPALGAGEAGRPGVAEGGPWSPLDIEHTQPALGRPGLERAALDQLRATAAKHFPETAAGGLSTDELISRAAARLEATPDGELGEVEIGVRAALALAEMKLDPATLAATLIVAVPSLLAQPDIVEVFGAEVGALVEGASR